MSQPDNKPETNPPEHQEAVRQDYDGAWKGSLENYFKDFLALLFPVIHDRIDWTKGHEFMNGELEKITRNAAAGRRYADKLVKVYYKQSGEKWLLIHVEIQGDPQADFAERMYDYWNLLRFRYGVNPESLAVFTDLNANFRPNSLTIGGEGQETLTTNHFTYPTVKLIDFETQSQWASLKENKNVFALLVMAQIKSKRLKGDTEALFNFRFSLARSLYGRGYTHEQILDLFDFIGWMLRLPENLEDELIQAVKAVEEELDVEHISSVERYGIKKGIEQGIEQAEKRFAQERLQERQEAEAQAAEKQRHSIHQLIVQGILNDTQIAEVFDVSAAYVAELRLGSQH